MEFKCYIALAFIVCSMSLASSLGISPAIKNINFAPGEEVKINFFVLDAVDGVAYDVILRGGDLMPYSSISSNEVIGNGGFVLTIKFPEKIEEPGEHTISVSVKERPSEESFIGTVVEVGSVIKTFVPYPGFYGDLLLNIPDGNVDDKIPIELRVINRGDNVLNLTNVYIDFISEGKIVKTLNFTPASIPVSEERYFRKYLDTFDIGPGNYIGRAEVFYNGILREANKSFRVGSLFVNITNFTEHLIGNGIQKFYITLESKWNSFVSGVYVDVNLSNSFNGVAFRTPSVDLISWEEKTIESYIDAENLEGYYNLTLNASYNGKSTIAYGQVLIEKDYKLIIYSVSAAVAVLFFAALYFSLRLFFRRKKK